MDLHAVSAHYTHGSLLDAIRDGLTGLGKTTATVTVDDLAPVDEFHVGGRVATGRLLDQMGLDQNSHILDVGCGLGGAARFAADRYGVRVTGIDLVQEYVETGNALSQWVKLQHSIVLQQGSVLAMPFADGSFDGAYMLHVGMNIEDKAGLFREVYRVLRPGACFAVYDIMRTSDATLHYPVPWAASPATSCLEPPQHYQQALRSAGFSVSEPDDRGAFALEFFTQLRQRIEASGGPPPLGLHTLMQTTTPLKVKNMLDGVAARAVAPVELIARKP